MGTTLSDAARASGLPKCARIIDAYKPGIPAPASPDAALVSASPASIPGVIGQLSRRGLQPALVATLRDSMADRPLEQALLAWDVLNGSLLPAGEVDRYRAEARAISTILPKAGRQHILIKPAEIERLVATIGVPAVQRLTGVALEEAVGDQALGVMRVMGVAPDAKLLDLARQRARSLHRAHLSSLAAFHLADLFFHHDFRPALFDLVEVLLDQEAADVESWLQNVSEPTVELQTYVRVRTLNNKEEWKSALAFADKGRAVFESTKLASAEAARISPRPTLAYAEASLRNAKPTVPYEHIAAITNLESPWRYAFRVLVLYGATRIKDAQFISLVQSFLESFGNDLHIWYDSLAAAPDGIKWGTKLTATLAREALALPHDPAVWKSVALLLGDDDASAGYDEVVARVRSQASL